MKKKIEIRGARVNNLRDISVDISKNTMTVVTGVSGSGKSSLVFDVLFSEGQRRYLESVGTYARRFMPLLKKPDVDFVFGLSPVIAIQQKKGIKNARSTVGTMTDISDYLRILYASFGIASCPVCKHEYNPKTVNQIAEHIISLPAGTQVEVFAPVSKTYGEPYSYLFDTMRKKGYRKFMIDGEEYDTSLKHSLQEDKEYRIEAFINKITIRDGIYKQLTAIIENGLLISERIIRLNITGKDIDNGITAKFYEDFGCPRHHVITGELLPYYFTPNDSESACSTCRGLGLFMRANPLYVIDNWNKSINKGALTNTLFNIKHPYKYMLLYSLAQHYGFSLDTPFKELDEKARDILFYGTNGQRILLVQPPDAVKKSPEAGKHVTYNGILNDLNEIYKKATRESREGKADNSWDVMEYVFKKHMSEELCPDCKGTRLKKTRSLIKVSGKSITEVNEMPVDELYGFIKEITVPQAKRLIAEPIINDILVRIRLLIDIGLSYLSIDRRAETLSGGEAQRIRLSTQLSAGLSGMLYVLDEPSIGLHSRDSYRVIEMMKKLRDADNTVVVVEHDMDTICQADEIIEIGPGPGKYGGYVVAQGSINEIMNIPVSITGDYLSGRKKIAVPDTRRTSNRFITIRGAKENNLKNVDVSIPLGVFTCVTGVSGSGKSSLINGILYKKLYSIKHDQRVVAGKHESLSGYEDISNVINIDQSPIGKSSRSNPATYVGIFDKIRGLFSGTDEAKKRGYEHTYFSPNNKEGRCEECSGIGYTVTELQFMPDVETICPVCNGARFHKDIPEIKFNGKDISEVLDMSVEEGINFFASHSYIKHKLSVMNDLGLGYIKLGQSSGTLSGGEAQRIKLATELSKIKKGTNNVYILDEPTTGLHWSDIEKLIFCLNRLVENGHTIIVIEHHMDIIKSADYIIDVGPEAGRAGGYIVACGTPEDIIKVPQSYTGKFLKEVLK